MRKKINQHGLSIMELLIAMSIVGIIAVISTQFLADQNKQNKNMEELLESRIDTLLADKILLKDFNRAVPSINHLKIKDDNGNQFYDYDSDVNGGALFTSIPQRFRSKTLTNEDPINRTHYVLLADYTGNGAIFTEPIVAYNVGAPPDINSPATLSYHGLGTFLAATPSTAKLLEANKLLYVDSFSYMPVTVNNKALRSAAFLGVPDSNGDLNKADLDSYFDYAIHSPNGVMTPINFDQFLRNLPPMGAGGASIRILSAKLIKYELVCDVVGVNNAPELGNGGKKRCDLTRAEWVNSAFPNPVIIMRDICGVTFHRESIKDTIFSVAFTNYKKGNCIKRTAPE